MHNVNNLNKKEVIEIFKQIKALLDLIPHNSESITSVFDEPIKLIFHHPTWYMTVSRLTPAVYHVSTGSQTIVYTEGEDRLEEWSSFASDLYRGYIDSLEDECRDMLNIMVGNF